jgi:hypothetical protein
VCRRSCERVQSYKFTGVLIDKTTVDGLSRPCTVRASVESSSDLSRSSKLCPVHTDRQSSRGDKRMKPYFVEQVRFAVNAGLVIRRSGFDSRHTVNKPPRNILGQNAYSFYTQLNQAFNSLTASVD